MPYTKLPLANTGLAGGYSAQRDSLDHEHRGACISNRAIPASLDKLLLFPQYAWPHMITRAVRPSLLIRTWLVLVGKVPSRKVE